MPLSIVRDDLVNRREDAIVLPSNDELVIDGGAGIAVARVAGLWRVRRACRKIGGCEVGDAVVTPAFKFPAQVLVHAVGPVWSGSAEDPGLLAAAYRSSLERAAESGCASIAMPLLSAGTFGCPSHVSLSIAMAVIEEFLAHSDMNVVLVLFDKKAVVASLDFLVDVESRIDDAYVDQYHAAAAAYDTGRMAPIREVGWLDEMEFGATRLDRVELAEPGLDEAADYRAQVPPPPMPSMSYGSSAPAAAEPRRSERKRRRKTERPAQRFGADEARFAPSATMPTAQAPMPRADEAAPAPSMTMPAMQAAPSLGLESRLDSMDESFSQVLLQLIDERGMTDSEVYHRANMTRQHFSKIRNNVGYHPSKATVWALCVALRLNLADTRDLLERAGFAISHASKFDIIVEYFIERGDYDSFRINETLFYFDQPLLG